MARQMGRIEKIVRRGIARSGIDLTSGQALSLVESVIEAYDGYLNDQAASGQVRLTPKRLALLPMIANGKSNEEIGRTLHLTENTIKTHLTLLYRAMNAENRAHAVGLSFLFGFVKPEEIADPTRKGPARAGLNRSGDPFKDGEGPMKSDIIRQTFDSRAKNIDAVDRGYAREVARVDPEVPAHVALRVIRAMRIVDESKELRRGADSEY